MKFYSSTECRVFLEKLCEEFELCPKYCHLQTNVVSCFHYQIKKCKGVCREEEIPELYNLRVIQAIESVQFKLKNFIIKESGRNKNEYAYVLILNGIYKGFGYINKKDETKSTEDYLALLNVQKDNKDIHRLLNSYLVKNAENIVPVEAYKDSLLLF
jgi:DNA polymerase-3 subunit epsilon